MGLKKINRIIVDCGIYSAASETQIKICTPITRLIFNFHQNLWSLQEVEVS
jgi:hypothetical protein